MWQATRVTIMRDIRTRTLNDYPGVTGTSAMKMILPRRVNVTRRRFTQGHEFLLIDDCGHLFKDVNVHNLDGEYEGK